MNSDFIFLYGPPASGKSSIGSVLAEDLNLPFYDLDHEIETQANRTIPEIFAEEGEKGFRNRESAVLIQLVQRPVGVVALGGGSLLKPENRSIAESCGQIICLTTPTQTILARLNQTGDGRPLLDGNQQENLEKLLLDRGTHYRSFEHQFLNNGQSPADAAWEIQINIGRFHAKGMGKGYPVRVSTGDLDQIGELLKYCEPDGQSILVSDDNVAKHYLSRVLSNLKSAGHDFQSVVLPAGEQAKSLKNVELLLNRFVKAGLDRHSLVLALGGGVIGDMTGFASAVFMRGVRWAVIPTSILSMVDASLGGKTGADMPQGKNLVGAFHPPVLVLADPTVLSTLPEVEYKNGFAEIVKHGVVGDPVLFDLCRQGVSDLQMSVVGIIRRAVAVKLKVIEADPYEKGLRASLNLGHTLGHALEAVSEYRIRHGEGVAIGMVAAARLSERIGIAQNGLASEIEACLLNLGLPVTIPSNLSHSELLAAMQYDKKRRHGRSRLVLPVRIGEVRWGFEMEDPAQLLKMLV